MNRSSLQTAVFGKRKHLGLGFPVSGAASIATLARVSIAWKRVTCAGTQAGEVRFE